MTTKKYLLSSVLLLITVSLFSCKINLDKNSNSTEGGNGNIVKKEFEISDYHKIKQSDLAKIVYQQKENEKPYLLVEIDSNLLSDVEVSVTNDELHVRLKKTKVKKTPHFVVYTNSKQLSAVSLSGVGSFVAENKVSADDLNLKMSGTGSITFQDLEADNVQARLSGTGSLKLIGRGNYSDFNVSGAGSIKTEDFVVKNADCKVSGVGSIYIYAEDKLDAKVSGVGSIKYKGEPKKISKSVSGVGSVKKI